MTIDETAVYVNKRLEEGYSIAKAERELSYGKDTLRKKLNRANYFFHKDKNQFIKDNTNSTQSITHTEKIINNKPITQTLTHDITHNKPSNIAKNDITQNTTQHLTQSKKESITQEYNTKATQPRAFTDEDFKILFQIIDEYKAKDKIKEKSVEIPKDDSELTTRSFRSYKSVFESFSKYCKDNNLNQKDAVAEALMTFIAK